MTDTAGMTLTKEPHYHAYIRRGGTGGRVFTQLSRIFIDRTTAHRTAVKLRPDGRDRFIQPCIDCPQPEGSKKRPIRWGAIADAVANRIGAERSDVRRALDDARSSERRARREQSESKPETGSEVVQATEARAPETASKVVPSTVATEQGTGFEVVPSIEATAEHQA